MNASNRTARHTQGQQFAKTMRYFLSIGTRTRRDRKGLDLHREIAEWVVTAAMHRGTLPPDGEAAFIPAFGAVSAWIKDIKNGRASYLVIEHINQLSPYQFCNLLGDMIDAGVSTSSAGAQYFNKMRTALLTEAAPVEEDSAPGKPEAAESAPTTGPRGGISRRLRKVVRRTRAAAQQVAKALGYRTLSGTIATHVEAGRLIRTGDFLDRIGGGDLPDGQQSWYGRHVAKAYRAANGSEPLKVWAQHRTTGRWIHVFVYGPIDPALYAGLRTYKGTQHLLADMYARCA